jgi:Fe-S oxidoreductase
MGGVPVPGNAPDAIPFSVLTRDFLLKYCPERFEEFKANMSVLPEGKLTAGAGKPIMQLTEKQIKFCMECGVCTGSCPVSYHLESFSPRQIIKRTLVDGDESFIHGHDVWACLSCARCSERCPVAIDFPEFIRTHREMARQEGNLPRLAHHGIFQSIARLQDSGLQQQRTAWAEGAGKFGQTGDVFYFVGCLPYFDPTFQYLGLSCIQSARSALTLLNAMGIEPVISNDERCCGHDALWTGNEELFHKLAEWNLDVIRKSGARKVLFNCPEGYMVFKRTMPAIFGELPFEVEHMSQFLAREIPNSGLVFSPSVNGSVTYHDPCRLGRWCSIYEEPRDLAGLIPGAGLKEMDRNRENALCCGTTAWMECSGCSKAMQIERLEEALQTGASTLLTACPKCQIHLTCARNAAELQLQVQDLYTYLADNLDQAQSAMAA